MNLPNKLTIFRVLYSFYLHHIFRNMENTLQPPSLSWQV